MPPTDTRRAFLKQTGSVALAAGAASWAVPGLARARGANDRLTLGIIGPGGQGTNLYRAFLKQPDVRISHVCDVDDNRLADAVNDIEKITGAVPQGVRDLRKVLDDKTIDAVVVATPDHWHAPATLLALAAGKHVYVEKPAAHNVREGRLMVDAARAAKCVVQVGTQSRSAAHVIKAVKLLQAGAIGDVLTARRGTASGAARSGNKRRPTRRSTSTTTRGSARRRWSRSAATVSTPSGGGPTTSAAATSATTASTTSTSPAGDWASRPTPRGSAPWAASTPTRTTTSSSPTRRPSATSTTSATAGAGN